MKNLESIKANDSAGLPDVPLAGHKNWQAKMMF
jgi:hypothetical protein